jgi:hypothetical protein
VSTDGSVAYGLANFGSLQFNTDGNVTIQEDSAMDLQGVSVVGGNLGLTAGGNITDTQNLARPQSSVTVAGDATLLAGVAPAAVLGDPATRLALGEIRLANTAAERFEVGGHALFTSVATDNRNVYLGTNDIIPTLDVPYGIANFGTISINAGNAYVHEDSNANWQSMSIDGDLVYTSQGYIKNLTANNVVVGNLTKLLAVDHIHLGFVKLNYLAAESRNANVLDNLALYASNTDANATGKKVVESLKGIAGNESTDFVGRDKADILKDYSYIDSLQYEYGVFVTNTQALTVQGVIARDLDAADRPNVYVETIGGKNLAPRVGLTVTGVVATETTSTTTDGAIVLIADGDLVINNSVGGRLETRQIGRPDYTQVVLQTQLVGKVYNGNPVFGDIAGYGEVATTKNLFAIDSKAIGVNNVGTVASKYHLIAVSFGITGEVGFEFVINYGDADGNVTTNYDGVVRTFDSNQDIYSATGIAGVRPYANATPINARNLGASQAIALLRNEPGNTDLGYQANYINDTRVIVSTVVTRRSTDFFLFSDGGETDLASVIDRSSNSAETQSLAGTEPPLPPQLDQNPVPPLPYLEFEVVINNSLETAYRSQLVEYDEPSAAAVGELEIAIYQVECEDLDNDGELDENERPPQSQILNKLKKPAVQSLGSKDPSDENISEWIKQFEDISNNRDPGLYAIIGEDRSRGSIVLRVFEIGGAPDSGTPQEQNEGKEPVPGDGDGAMLLLPSPGDSGELFEGVKLPLGGSELIHIEQSKDGFTPVSSVDAESSDPLLEEKRLHESTVSSSMLAVGGLLWLNGFRNRRRLQSEKITPAESDSVDYSKEARRKRRISQA